MAEDDEQATRKQPARKRSSKKQDGAGPAKKPAKKTTKKTGKKAARKTSEKSSEQGRDRSGSRSDGRTAPKASASRRPKPLELARDAAHQLADLTGREPESTTGVERTDDGWRIELEVVETRRIPDSADILALYEVQVDQDGDLLGYRRVRRYPRGRTDPADGGGR